MTHELYIVFLYINSFNLHIFLSDFHIWFYVKRNDINYA